MGSLRNERINNLDMSILVSIIIPAYNCEKWIEQSILSAISQSWKNKEILIVNDGSTDKTMKIAKKYESSNVKIVTQENSGAAAARNTGLRLAQGDYIQWLDGDDILAKDKIELQIEKEIIDRDEDILWSASFGNFYYKPERAKFVASPLWNDLDPIEWLVIKMKHGLWMNPAVWLVSRKLSEHAGPWDETLSLDDDGEYFSRVVACCKRIKFIENAKAYYRVGNSKSLSMRRTEKALESAFRATALCINNLIRKEKSERTLYACKKFLEHRLLYYFNENKYFHNQCLLIGKQLGLSLVPLESAGLVFLRRMLGREVSYRIRADIWEMRLALRKLIEKIF